MKNASRLYKGCINALDLLKLNLNHQGIICWKKKLKISKSNFLIKIFY